MSQPEYERVKWFFKGDEIARVAAAQQEVQCYSQYNSNIAVQQQHSLCCSGTAGVAAAQPVLQWHNPCYGVAAV